MGLIAPNPEHSPRSTDNRDRGAMLILTLLLTVVLSVIVMSIAVYTATGLRSSRVATDRNEGNAAASTAISWAIEEFAAKRLYPSDCDGSPLPLPAGVVADTASVELTCIGTADVNASPGIRLVSSASISGGVDRDIEAIVQVPNATYEAIVIEWNGVLPVAPIVTTTTTTTTPPTTLPGALACEFEVLLVSGGIGSAELVIRNNTANQVRGWTVAITHEGNTIDLWSTRNQSSDATQHYASNEGPNANIDANSSVIVSSGVVTGPSIQGGDRFSCAVIAQG